MTNDEIVRLWNEMIECFGSLPSPIHEPQQFAYYVKLFKYYKSRT